jgi:uncharacterized membrane protein
MMMMMGFWLIAPLLLLISVVAYALGWRPLPNQTGPAQTGQPPTEILKARYASGDITRDEYEQLRRDLEA